MKPETVDLRKPENRIEHSERKVILFDLDHTIFDSRRRDHMIELARATDDWVKYHSDSIDDKPCYDITHLLTCFRHTGHAVIGITARPERYRAITLISLKRHKIWLDDLLMHKREMWEPSAELKLALARERFGENIGAKVLFIIDDHPEVVKAFQAAGVTALQVYGRKYDE